MSEQSDQEKTEPASPRRLEKSREDGQVARSAELTTFAILISAGAGLWFMSGHLAGQLATLMKDGMRVSRETSFDSGRLVERLSDQMLDILIAFSPFLILMFAGGTGRADAGFRLALYLEVRGTGLQTP